MSDVTGSVQPIDDATLQALAEKSGDSVEHVKAMLNVAETGQAPAKDQPNTLLAGKYKTEEDLDKGIQSLIEKFGKENAYKIMEGQLGKPKEEPKVEDPLKAPVNQDADKTKDALSGGVPDAKEQPKGVDFEKFTKEFTESGQLSEDSYKELQDAGIPKDVVDSYIAGHQAQAQAYTNSVYEQVGGQTAYQTLVEWAATNLNEGEKSTFNNAVASGDKAQASIVVDALKARYERANGTMKRNALEPKEVPDSSAGQGYRSVEEWKADMQDPRYGVDPAFVQYVQDKVKKTSIF